MKRRGPYFEGERRKKPRQRFMTLKDRRHIPRKINDVLDKFFKTKQFQDKWLVWD